MKGSGPLKIPSHLAIRRCNTRQLQVRHDNPIVPKQSWICRRSLTGQHFLSIKKAWQEAHPGEKRPQPHRQQRMNRYEEIVRRLDDDPSLSMKALATELGISGLTVSKAWQETHPGEKRRPQPYRQPRMNRHEEIVIPILNKEGRERVGGWCM